MTHDQMCRWHGSTEFDTVVSCDECDLIAKVREDATATSVQRVEALPHSLECVTRDTHYNRACNFLRGDALDAIKGEQ
jgi:hypothetical protein